MIHCRSTLEKLRACCAEGSAMFMIVMSSTIISWASPIRARISQRRRSPSAGALGWPGAAEVAGVAIFFSHLEIQPPLTPPTITEVDMPSPLLGRMLTMSTAERPPEEESSLVSEPERPLRRNIVRNQDWQLTAAAEDFTVQGQ